MDNDTSWNYDELAEKLAMGRVDVDEAAIPLVLEEARKRRDVHVIAHVASWYEDVKDDKPLYLELAKEAAELGSPEANFWLGHEYLSGEMLPRDYEKAYSCFIKGKDVDWVPIDPDFGRSVGEILRRYRMVVVRVGKASVAGVEMRACGLVHEARR